MLRCNFASFLCTRDCSPEALAAAEQTAIQAPVAESTAQRLGQVSLLCWGGQPPSLGLLCLG